MTSNKTNSNQQELEKRRVKNMQGLLKFCAESTKVEDTTHPSQMLDITDEKRIFLENVLNELKGDDVNFIANCLHNLTSTSIKNEEDDIAEQERSLDALSEYVEDLNYALDVQKLNGFTIIIDCLKCPHNSLQKRAANLIGNICQNYEESQKNMLEQNAMPILLQILDNHPDAECKVKALYALSCLVRNYQPAEDLFVKSSGFSFLIKCLKSKHHKLVMKSLFLLTHFLHKDNRYKDSLSSMGFVEQFIIVMVSDLADDEIKEYCVKSLLNFCSVISSAVTECLRPEFNLIDCLKRRRQAIVNQEDFAMEEHHINSLLQMLSTHSDDGDDTMR